MGLDNGIIIKNLPKEDYKYFTNIIDKTTEEDEVEICYWRKCYNIRHIFLSTFKVIKNGKVTDWEGGGTFDIERDDIPHIIRRFIELLIPKNWNESESIWTYDEIVESIINDIVTLKMLYIYMEINPNIEVYFYDSY